MFSLYVHSDNLDFLAFLHQESTYKSEEDAFLFTHIEQASRVLARYLLFFMKEKHFQDMLSQSTLSVDDKDELLLYLSSDNMAKIYHVMYQKLLVFLSESSSFHFEGFLQFRLNSENEMVAKLLRIAYHEFLEYSQESSNVNHLKIMMEEQPSLEEQIDVIVEQDGTFTIKGQHDVYLEGETEEDTMLSHVILLSPERVNIYELGGSISPTYTILLTQLFEKQVVFHGFNDGASSHQKTEK